MTSCFHRNRYLNALKRKVTVGVDGTVWNILLMAQMSKWKKDRGVEMVIGQTSEKNTKEKEKNKLNSKYSMYQLFHEL